MQFLTIEELKQLDSNSAAEYCNTLREYLINNVGKSGSHLASNLGVAEISVALIRCFNSPEDRIIYDVGHQSYIHNSLRTFNGYSGFTKRDESCHDPFGAGHSSTALSAAVGFSRASALKGESSYTVAVIGDGAFCTGMTFEALNNISSDDRLIIILNDNEMSISKNVGAMSAYLNRIRLTKKYLTLKRKTKRVFSKTPLIFKFVSSIKHAMKRVLIKPNLFEDLGIYYMGPADGNDLDSVETLINEAKKRKSPVILHFVTKKGKGLKEAEDNPGKYHFVSTSDSPQNSFSKEYVRLLSNYSDKNENAVAITAAMCDGTGLSAYREKFPNRLFDVGISEEHAATFSAALSAGGMLPFYTVYSTFFQRSYDQVLHDIALQNLKTVIALDRAGIVGADGATHHGLYDVSMMLNVPGSVIYSPASYSELEYSFNKCVDYNGLSVMRYPKGEESELVARVFDKPSDFSFDTVCRCDVLLVTYGRITDEVLKAKILLEAKGHKVSVLKFLKLKPIAFEEIARIIKAASPSLVCVVEEGMKTGGFGEYLLSNIDINTPSLVIAVDEMFVPQGTVSELFDYCGISCEKIYSRIIKCL